MRDIGARGGEGFAYYLPEVAAWLGRTAERDGQASALARTIRARAEAAQRRAKTDAGAAVGASALDEATFGLRSMGLTWREIGILREMEQLSREGSGSTAPRSRPVSRSRRTRCVFTSRASARSSTWRISAATRCCSRPRSRSGRCRS